jgi:hypothetical protein
MKAVQLPIALSFVLVSFASIAQQSPGTTGDTIGHPPPLAGPPAESAPTTKQENTAPPPQGSQQNTKGYLGAYAPPGTPPTPYSTGPLPTASTGAGLNVAAPDGSMRSVRAVPCSTVARETDGFTTCVGIPDDGGPAKRRR